MSEQLPQAPEGTGDYGYDEAHDVPQADAHATRPAHHQHPHPVHVVTQSSDHQQDYGYDLAHEIPPA